MQGACNMLAKMLDAFSLYWETVGNEGKKKLKKQHSQPKEDSGDDWVVDDDTDEGSEESGSRVIGSVTPSSVEAHQWLLFFCSLLLCADAARFAAAFSAAAVCAAAFSTAAV